MAHFAELDEFNNVIRTIVINNNDLMTQDGKEIEESGIELAKKLTGSSNRFVQASYNGSFRRQFPNRQGFTYDESLDVFIEPSPFPSWSLDESGYWQPPVPKPENTDDVIFVWNEEQLVWEQHVIASEPQQ